MTELFLLHTSELEGAEAFAAAMASVPEARRRKVERLSDEVARRRSLGAAVLMARGFAAHGLDPRHVALAEGPHGKPFLAGGGLFFNVSHSGDWVAAAFSASEVGVDVEEVGAWREGVAARVTTAAERAHLAAFPEGAARTAEFYRLWTIKESFLKYLGTGLATDMRKVEVAAWGPVALHLEGAPQEVAVHEFELPGCKLAVCGRDATCRRAPLPAKGRQGPGFLP